jgi:lipoprotein NlpD
MKTRSKVQNIIFNVLNSIVFFLFLTSSVFAQQQGVEQFQWPANGKVIQTFTPINKGIEISGSLGDPVYAVADGKVIYAGNEVAGFGNLIIINHGGKFMSSYAHNNQNRVAGGDFVTKGSQIAWIGQTESNSPKLYFRLSTVSGKMTTPVDPLAYLPKR